MDMLETQVLLANFPRAMLEIANYSTESKGSMGLLGQNIGSQKLTIRSGKGN